MSETTRFSRAEARFRYAERYDRGTRYNDRHLQDVSIESRETNRFVVHFPDSDEGHVVDLAADEGDYVGSCTCGDFEYRETICKHMWAVFADPTSAVIDLSATTSDPRAIADGGAVATPAQNGQAPTYGDDVEIAVAERYDLELIDAAFYDARATETTPTLEAGTPIQIKGAQEKIRNGYDRNGNQKYTTGRLTLWREELLHLLMDGGRYVVATYADEHDPDSDEFLTRIRVLSPKQIDEAVQSNTGEESPWHDAHRPSKGERAKLAWTKVMGGDPDV